MKLAYSIEQCAEIMFGKLTASAADMVTHVVYDTRKITQAKGGLFFSLDGLSRKGDVFLGEAILKGISLFVVHEKCEFDFPETCAVLRVNDTLSALQQFATHHRKQFSYPVFAITGSYGKTTFKEWAFHLLSDRYKIIRSPKSFNSQIGVALSLLELTSDAELAFIEAGISQGGEMQKLRDMIQPDYGIFTGFGTAHRGNFTDESAHLKEKLSLFTTTKHTFVPAQFAETLTEIPDNFEVCPEVKNERFSPGYFGMLGVLKQLCLFLTLPLEKIENELTHLPSLALRMEVFDGINGNTIINDTYNLDTDALQEALIQLRNYPSNKKRVVLIGLSENTIAQKATIEALIAQFPIDEVQFILPGEHIQWETIQHSIVLIKASRDRSFETEVALGKAIKHRTFVEVNLAAIRNNLNCYKELLPVGTQLLGMVKANAYGAGATRIAQFLKKAGVAYLGVAYADEGVRLRQAGIQTPILVMNPDMEHAASIIEYQLEPAIYSFGQLDEFTTFLIHKGMLDFPIQLKFDTGMHRLGFRNEDATKLLSYINAQPEVRISGVFSHLADADNFSDGSFTAIQTRIFEEIVIYFKSQLNYSFTAHLFNSEGALTHESHPFDMVRLGIGMYGYSSNPMFTKKLEPAIRWMSSVSQIQRVKKGETIGYGRSFEADKDMEIAIIAVGYADGFSRSLSNGKGAVFIAGKRCQVVGRVCMDMTMIDVTGLGIKENDPVEIIGEHQFMNEFARNAGTISYEIMTLLSSRMERIYLDF